MKRNRPYLLLAALALFELNAATAQTDNFAYAITDISPTGRLWGSLRKIDLTTGKASDVLLQGTGNYQNTFDAITKKSSKAIVANNVIGSSVNEPFGDGVAAIALDKTNNRLYFTPLRVDQLRYVDLNTMKVYFINGTNLSNVARNAADESSNITRMVFDADGNGYAISNDGKSLVRFATSNTFAITHLGEIKDINTGSGVSIHTPCTSFGGDCIADDEGNLILFSAYQHVFKININSKTATHLGVIQGLPADCQINAACVDQNNQIVISSATKNYAFFNLDLATLTAKPILTQEWLTSDLANSNILNTKKPEIVKTKEARVEVKNIKSTLILPATNAKVALFPNPVITDNYNLSFAVKPGRYAVKLQDIVGKSISTSSVIINAKNQVQNFRVPSNVKPGVYLVLVTDTKTNSTVFTQKVVVSK